GRLHADSSGGRAARRDPAARPARSQLRRALGRPPLHAPALAVPDPAADPDAAEPERGDVADDRRGAGGGGGAQLPGPVDGPGGLRLHPGAAAARLLRRRARALARDQLPGRHLPRPRGPLRDRGRAADRARRARRRGLGLDRRLDDARLGHLGAGAAQDVAVGARARLARGGRPAAAAGHRRGRRPARVRTAQAAAGARLRPLLPRLRGDGGDHPGVGRRRRRRRRGRPGGQPRPRGAAAAAGGDHGRRAAGGHPHVRPPAL
ncbi:MAG: CDP-diacylglycerol--glycerol-3-phosphate 3-phosphatidyltransferase, partial [uncultured Solirubrobacteraceae bacterium]